jgi:hypothetical protein
MKRTFWPITLLATAIFFFVANSACLAENTISATEYKAGDVVTIKGTIPAGEELYIAIAQLDHFASKDTDGVNEEKKISSIRLENCV